MSRMKRAWHEQRVRAVKWIIRKAVRRFDELNNFCFIAYSWPYDEVIDYHVTAERTYKNMHIVGTLVEYYGESEMLHDQQKNMKIQGDANA